MPCEIITIVLVNPSPVKSETMPRSCFHATLKQILRSKGACIAVAAFFLLIYLIAHFRAGMNFPCPWPDEADFLWQATAFAETGGLTSPILHPDRPILWMPPGYMVIMGLLGKILPLSLQMARSVSMICMLIASGLLVFALQKALPSLLAGALVGLYWLGDPLLVTGNIARMEAPLLVILLSGSLLLRGDRFWKALAFFAAAPLMHPNGLLFLFASLAWGAGSIICSRKIPRFTVADSAILCLVMLAWLIYAAFISAHWSDFLSDMAFQWNRKHTHWILAEWRITGAIFACLCAFLLAFGIWAKDRETLFLVAMALPSWIAWNLGEMWYDAFGSLSYLLVTAALLRIGINWLPNTRFMLEAHKSRRWAFYICVLAGVTQWSLGAGLLTSPLKWLDDRYWRGIQQTRTPYLTKTDRAALQEHLAGLGGESGSLPTVEFFPRGDSLLFKSLHGKVIRISQPLFYRRIPDFYIIHLSRSLPQGGWSGLVDNAFRQAGIGYSRDNTLIYQRGETEVWHCIRTANSLRCSGKQPKEEEIADGICRKKQAE